MGPAHRLLSAQLTGHTLSNAASPLTLLQVECEWGNPGTSRGSGMSGDDDDDDDGECGPGKEGTTRQSVATGALANPNLHTADSYGSCWLSLSSD
jgi:hypothetical protein